MTKNFISILLIVSLISLYKADDKDDFQKLAEQLIKFRTYRVGYLSKKPEDTVITTNEEFIQKLPNYSNYHYDGEGNIVSSTTDGVVKDFPKKFFDEKNLALVYVGTSTGSITIKSVKTAIKDNRVTISYRLDLPLYATADMNGWLIAVPVNKTVTDVYVNRDIL